MQGSHFLFCLQNSIVMTGLLVGLGTVFLDLPLFWCVQEYSWELYLSCQCSLRQLGFIPKASNEGRTQPWTKGRGRAEQRTCGEAPVMHSGQKGYISNSCTGGSCSLPRDLRTIIMEIWRRKAVLKMRSFSH